MKVAIHQPHYFPWVGYFDKMAKVDAFVLLDQVQFGKNSLMQRNRVVSTNGEIKYLTISADIKSYLMREYRDIQISSQSDWKNRQLNAVKNYYRLTPGFATIFPLFEQFLSQDYSTVCQWTCASIMLIRDILGIKTPIIYQSKVDYDHMMKKSDLVYGICNALNADIYFSGRGGSVEYLDRDKFENNGVKIVFQDFSHPIYPQVNTNVFIPGISILDMLFNCGIENTCKCFWDNVESSCEFSL